MTEPHIQRIYGGLDSPCSPENAVRTVLRPGETLLWAGRPAPLGYISNLAPWLFAIGLFFLVCGGFFAGYAFLDLILEGTTIDWLRFLQGALFVGQGLCFVLMGGGFSLQAAWKHYAITDQRAFIVNWVLRRRVTSFAPEDIKEPLRLDRDDGYGHLIFAKRRKNLLLQDKDRSRYVGIGFFRVRDVAKVEAELLKLRARARADAAAADMPVPAPA